MREGKGESQNDSQVSSLGNGMIGGATPWNGDRESRFGGKVRSWVLNKKKKKRSWVLRVQWSPGQMEYGALHWKRNHFSSFTQSCPTLCNPTDCSMLGFPVHHQLLELTQTHVHQVGDVIQPPNPLLSPPPAFNLSQHQGIFKWVSSLHQVAKILEFQL